MFAQSNPQIHCVDKNCMYDADIVCIWYHGIQYRQHSASIKIVYTLVSRYNGYSIWFTTRQSCTFFLTSIHQHFRRNSGHVSQRNWPQFSSEQGSKERPRFPDIKDATVRLMCFRRRSHWKELLCLIWYVIMHDVSCTDYMPFLVPCFVYIRVYIRYMYIYIYYTYFPGLFCTILASREHWTWDIICGYYMQGQNLRQFLRIYFELQMHRNQQQRGRTILRLPPIMN